MEMELWSILNLVRIFFYFNTSKKPLARNGDYFYEDNFISFPVEEGFNDTKFKDIFEKNRNENKTI